MCFFRHCPWVHRQTENTKTRQEKRKGKVEIKSKNKNTRTRTQEQEQEHKNKATQHNTDTYNKRQGKTMQTQEHRQDEARQHNTMQHNTQDQDHDRTRQDTTRQLNPAQHNTTQHNTTQHITTQPQMTIKHCFYPGSVRCKLFDLCNLMQAEEHNEPHFARNIGFEFYLCQCPIMTTTPQRHAVLPHLQQDIEMYVLCWLTHVVPQDTTRRRDKTRQAGQDETTQQKHNITQHNTMQFNARRCKTRQHNTTQHKIKESKARLE